jgi:exonuclease III
MGCDTQPPTIPVIALGDFNIVLEDRDSINKNANANEVSARRRQKSF